MSHYVSGGPTNHVLTEDGDALCGNLPSYIENAIEYAGSVEEVPSIHEMDHDPEEYPSLCGRCETILLSKA